MPCIIGRNGVKQILELSLTQEEMDKFNGSAAILEENFNGLKLLDGSLSGGSNVKGNVTLSDSVASKTLATIKVDCDLTLDYEAAKAEFAERAAEGYVCPIEPGAAPIAL